MKVTIIGGGIIGLSCAYSLTKSGHDVTVIDSGTCGEGATRGNAGWIVPSLSQPFNAPGALWDAMKSMLHPGSTIRFQTVPDINFLKWLALFYRNSSASNSAYAREALVALNQRTVESFDRMLNDVKAEIHHDGLLLPFLTDSGMEGFLRSHEQITAAGYGGELREVSAQRLLDSEPALSTSIIGGFHLVDEKSIRPESLVSGLLEWLRAAETEIVENCSVHALQQKAGGWDMETSQGLKHTDQIVVAAGASSAKILKTAGVKLGLEPGRGASITVTNGPTLQHPVKLAEVRVACTPFKDGTRFSGTFDFAGHARTASVGRMRSVLKQASAYFPTLKNFPLSHTQVWSGLRPCTPDSIPYIGPVPDRKGLLVATGHGTLGITLGPVTGEAIAGLVDNHPAPPYIQACALDRPQLQLL